MICGKVIFWPFSCSCCGLSTKSAFRLMLQSKKFASTIFCQLVVNRWKNCDRTRHTATETRVDITEPSVMQSTDSYAVNGCKFPFGQLLVDDLSFSQNNSWIRPCIHLLSTRMQCLFLTHAILTLPPQSMWFLYNITFNFLILKHIQRDPWWPPHIWWEVIWSLDEDMRVIQSIIITTWSESISPIAKSE